MKKVFYYMICVIAIFILALILIYNSNKTKDNNITVADATITSRKII